MGILCNSTCSNMCICAFILRKLITSTNKRKYSKGLYNSIGLKLKHDATKDNTGFQLHSAAHQSK